MLCAQRKNKRRIGGSRHCRSRPKAAILFACYRRALSPAAAESRRNLRKRKPSLSNHSSASLSDSILGNQRPTRQRYIVMTFLCVLSFLTYFDRACIVRAQEDIQLDLNISDDQMGWILSIFWFAYAVFEIPGGWMGDRYGARVTLTRIVFAWSLFTVLSGCATGFISLFMYRFLFGAGEAGAYPNMARVQSRWLSAPVRARAGGLLWLLARWGGAFSPMIFGAMLRFFDASAFRNLMSSIGLSSNIAAWRMAFLAAGMIGAVWCVAFYWWFRDDPAQSPAVNDAELAVIRADQPRTAEKHSMPPVVWRALLTCPSLWAMGMLYVFGSFGWNFFMSWMPRYLKDVHQVTFEKSEVMTGAPLFFGGITCLIGGVLSDYLVRRTGNKWLGRVVFPMAGYTTAAVSMFCVRYAQTPQQAAFLMCLAGAGNDFGQGANWATIVDIGGRYAGTAAGFINMVGNAGNYLQPRVGEWIFRTQGWNVLMTTYAAFFFAAAAMWLFINPNRTFYQGKVADEAAR